MSSAAESSLRAFHTPQRDRQTDTHVHMRACTHLLRVNYTRIQKEKAPDLTPGAKTVVSLAPSAGLASEKGQEGGELSEHLSSDIHLLCSQASPPPLPEAEI